MTRALPSLLLLSIVALVGGPPGAGQDEPARPNVVLILADDLGYADIGVHGCRDIPTPNIDSLAREGVRCTNGYTSSPRCAPARCGLLTGRYPQRFGVELSAEPGLPLEEKNLAERLQQAGYATGLVGKWHLGLGEDQHPNARGFDEFFGFLDGSNEYLPLSEGGVVPHLLRDREPAAEQGYLTEALGREAAAFLERHREERFFLYLAFNAPHRPIRVTATHLARFRHIADPERRRYAAMVSALDDAVGVVLAKLAELGLDEETLVFFLNDNGGPLGKREQGNGCSNAPLRGAKGSTWEGGIRVPFLARWKGTLPAGALYEQPVITLDVAPTVLSLAGAVPGPEWKPDGVDLLPHLTGRAERAPHLVLYWRFNLPPGVPELHRWAIRRANWKLVHSPEFDPVTGDHRGVSALGLYDVAADPGETTDLIESRPEKARELEALWLQWSSRLPPIRSSDQGEG